MFLCVSMQKNSSAKNSEGPPVFRALHVCDVHHSLHQNGSIWYGLEDLSCIPSVLSSSVVIKGRVRCPVPPRLSAGNAYETCDRFRFLPSCPWHRVDSQHDNVSRVRRARDQGLDCVAPHSIEVVAPPERRYLIWIERGNQQGENLCASSFIGNEASGSTT